MMLELQGRGCHNINFVSPTHFAPQMARAILIAAENGLRLPIVYNTNAYDSVEVLCLLDGIVDIYLPDLKYAEDEAGYLFSKVPRYREISRAALKEMFRQTGDDLVYNENGLLQRGLVIRLLVLPNDIGGLRESLEWIRDELSPRVAISLMAQYYPTNVAGTNPRYTVAVAPDQRKRMAASAVRFGRIRINRRLDSGVRRRPVLLPARLQ
jgi:putative pyruvate formate lyase activating enzyme